MTGAEPRPRHLLSRTMKNKTHKTRKKGKQAMEINEPFLRELKTNIDAKIDKFITERAVPETMSLEQLVERYHPDDPGDAFGSELKKRMGDKTFLVFGDDRKLDVHLT